MKSPSTKFTCSNHCRRRDELDDFLDSVADPLSSCAKVSSSIVKPVKRPYLHSDNETNFSLTRADKRSRQRQRFPEDNTSASTNKVFLCLSFSGWQSLC